MDCVYFQIDKSNRILLQLRNPDIIKFFILDAQDLSLDTSYLKNHSVFGLRQNRLEFLWSTLRLKKKTFYSTIEDFTCG